MSTPDPIRSIRTSRLKNGAPAPTAMETRRIRVGRAATTASTIRKSEKRVAPRSAAEGIRMSRATKARGQIR